MTTTTIGVSRPATPGDGAAGQASALLAAFRAVAADHADTVAVRGGHTKMTYRQLDQQVTEWATRLAAVGKPPRSIVALPVADPAYLPAAVLAVRAAGLVPMLLDPHSPAGRREAIMSAARPALTMVVRETADITEGAAQPRTLPAGAGYLGFTSGTQGPPKGIVANESGVRHFVDWEISTLGVHSGWRVAMISPPTFEVVFREMFVALCSGAELVAAQASVRADPRAVLPWLAEQRIGVVHAVPSLASRWLDATPEVVLDDLRWTLFAGEPLHSYHVDGWRRRAGGTRIINLYGPSETTLAKFWYAVPPDRRDGPQPVGRPLPGTRLLTLHLDGPGDEPGNQNVFRIGIESPYGSFGYLDGTATPADHQALVRAGGRTIFHSQDLGSLDDSGNLVLHGRRDSRVKRRGVFVDLSAIEDAANRHKGVTLSACVQTDVADASAVILLVEVDGDTVMPRLRRALLRELGPQAPDRVVRVDRIPLSTNGKIDRGALRQLMRGSDGMTENACLAPFRHAAGDARPCEGTAGKVRPVPRSCACGEAA